jgi:hypothetical protein
VENRDAEANFRTACRDGIDAELLWPSRRRLGGVARVPAVRLVLDELLPMAAAGLDAWGVDAADRDRYLGVIEKRCRRRVNGASWQKAAFHRELERGLDRQPALAAMTRRYCELTYTEEPVHSWPLT